MKIKYDNCRSIDISDLTEFLESYAKGVMCRMQKADPKFSDCWTACVINFDNFAPQFEWGSPEDLAAAENELFVELPLQEQ